MLKYNRGHWFFRNYQYIFGSWGLPKLDLEAYFRGPLVTDSIGNSVMTDWSGNGNDIDVFSYCPTLAGTEVLTLAHLTGSETVATSYGTSTPTVGSGQITFTAGTIQYVLLSDDTELVFEDSNGTARAAIINVDGTGRYGAFSSAITFDTLINSSYLAKFGGREAYVDDVDYTDGLADIGSTVDYDPIVTASGTSLTVTRVTTNPRAFVNLLPTIVGAKYRFIATAHDYTTDVYLYVKDGLNGAGSNLTTDYIHSSDNVFTTEFTATTTTTSLGLFGINESFTLDNIEVNLVVDGVLPGGLSNDSLTGKIVCMGDSTTGGNYPLILQQIYKNATIVDAGVAGNTVAQMLARFETDVVDEAPDFVYYFGAANSIIADVSLASMQSDILSMIALATSNNIQFVAGTPLPFGNSTYWNASRQTVTDSLTSWILALTNVLAVVDLYTPLLESGTDNLLASYDSGDGLHPSRKGDAAITNAFLSAHAPVSAPKTFNNVLDAPVNVFALNAPIALESSDDSNVWFTASVANDVDPADLALNDSDKIFKGEKALVFYSTALTGNDITRAERYVD